MTLLPRGRRMPRAKTIRPAERYLSAGAEGARQLGHSYVGTEHVLNALAHDPDGAATLLLARLGVTAEAVQRELACWLEAKPQAARIDPQALATLGIDLEAVRDSLDQTFGPGALERTRSGCLGICPRLKLALAYALDCTAGHPLDDDHVLLGILNVPDSVAARVLSELGVTLGQVQSVVDAGS
jgi:ATP-dependent Clp protease ATP-binding subunit ClpA